MMTGTTRALTVRDLTDADLPSLGWAGSPRHVRALAHRIRRARAGETDGTPRRYETVCTLMRKHLA